MLAETRVEPGTYLSDDQALDLAVACARNGIRSANPLVGSVILDAENRLISTGWHQGAGTAHAEVDALTKAQQAGKDLTRASIFVSLEPCNHTGRTGPCSLAIAQAGISRLIYAHQDETAQAAGGADYLKAQGLEVDYRPLKAAEEVNARWFLAQGKRPFITVKIASSLGGYVAAADGTSQWITGPEARADGHALRARTDAILIGTQTAINDDPQLTARTRDGQIAQTQPLRVVMGERTLPRRLSLAQAIAKKDNAVQLKTLSPLKAAESLYDMGVRHLMIEGGPTIITAFLDAGLVDEIRWYQAPVIFGAGRRAVGNLGIETLNDAQRWQLDDLGMEPAIERLGNDVRLRLKPTF